MGLSKYLKAFKNSKQILEGIKNNIFKQEHIEAEAEARFDICKQCTALDREGLHCLMSGTEPCCADVVVDYKTAVAVGKRPDWM